MPLIQTILQSHRKQDSMVFSERRTEQQNKIENRYKPTYIWATDFWQKRQEYVIEKRKSFQQMVLKKTEQPYAKEQNYTTILYHMQQLAQMD